MTERELRQLARDLDRIDRFRHRALEQSEVWREWDWTPETREEAEDSIRGLRAALDLLTQATQ
jgi:hypothetical protein